MLINNINNISNISNINNIKNINSINNLKGGKDGLVRGACSASMALPRPTIVRTCCCAVEDYKGGDDSLSTLPIINVLGWQQLSKIMVDLAKR